MKGISFNIINMEEVMKRINTFSSNTKLELKKELAASALKIQSEAKKNAPVNFGTLRQSIYMIDISNGDKFGYKVGTKASYAPYVEFGTGGKVNIPSKYSSYASMFKGKKGGKFADMVKALMKWVQKKGLASGKNVKSVAYAIAISILRKGMRAQPFLLPAFESEKSKLKGRIKNILSNVKS